MYTHTYTYNINNNSDACLRRLSLIGRFHMTERQRQLQYLLITTEVCRPSVKAHVQPQSRWAASVQDHAGCHHCSLRTANCEVTIFQNWKARENPSGQTTVESEFGVSDRITHRQGAKNPPTHRFNKLAMSFNLSSLFCFVFPSLIQGAVYFLQARNNEGIDKGGDSPRHQQHLGACWSRRHQVFGQ